MKAIVCKELGPPSKLVLEEIENPKLKSGEVLVNIKACSVNFPDTLIIQGLYQFKPDLPFVPGSDIAGEVEAVGEEVTHVKPGDKVFGMVIHGGFAEKTVVPAERCFLIPDSMSYEIAASFMMAYATSYHALKDRAHMQQGETVLVLGAAGGVGLAAVELAKQLGGNVIAAASSSAKLAVCKSYGADHSINYSSENIKDRIKEITNGTGVDIVYDPVGGTYAETSFRSIAPNGRYLVVGFAAGNIPSISLNLPLLKMAQIVGVFWGAFAMSFPKENMKNTAELMQMYVEGKIKPHIYKKFPLPATPKALEAIMHRKVIGKVVITV